MIPIIQVFDFLEVTTSVNRIHGSGYRKLKIVGVRRSSTATGPSLVRVPLGESYDNIEFSSHVDSYGQTRPGIVPEMMLKTDVDAEGMIKYWVRIGRLAQLYLGSSDAEFYCVGRDSPDELMVP